MVDRDQQEQRRHRKALPIITKIEHKFLFIVICVKKIFLQRMLFESMVQHLSIQLKCLAVCQVFQQFFEQMLEDLCQQEEHNQHRLIWQNQVEID